MNWKIGGSRASNGLKRKATAGIESVNPTELPIGQMYHVTVDNRVPYRVYGGVRFRLN